MGSDESARAPRECNKLHTVRSPSERRSIGEKKETRARLHARITEYAESSYRINSNEGILRAMRPKGERERESCVMNDKPTPFPSARRIPRWNNTIAAGSMEVHGQRERQPAGAFGSEIAGEARREIF